MGGGVMSGKRGRDRTIDGDEGGTTLNWADAMRGYGIDNFGDQSAETESALTTIDPNRIGFKKFILTPVGLEIAEDVSQDDWQELGRFFKRVKMALQFWIGDWINSADASWGDTYTEAELITGFKQSYLRNIAWVSGQVHLSFRNDKLSFNHHRFVAPLNDDEQKAWLDHAVEKRLSAAKLRKAIEGKPTQPKGDSLRSYHIAARKVIKGYADGSMALKDVLLLRQLIDQAEAKITGQALERIEPGNPKSVLSVLNSLQQAVNQGLPIGRHIVQELFQKMDQAGLLVELTYSFPDRIKQLGKGNDHNEE
jgi:hypothetical protein